MRRPPWTTCRRSWRGRAGARPSSSSAPAPTPRIGADRGGIRGRRAARPGRPRGWVWRLATPARARGLGRLARGRASGWRRRPAAAGGGRRGVLTVDAHRGGAGSARPGFGLAAYLTRHGAKARVKQVAASAALPTHPRPGGRGEGGSPGDRRYGQLAGARDDVQRRDQLDPGGHRLPDPGLALTPTCGRSCASARARSA